MIITLALFTGALVWFTRSSWVSKIPGESRTVVVETSPRVEHDRGCATCGDDEHYEAVGGEYRWNGDLAAGKVLEVKGISGSVHAMKASGDRFEVVATKHGRSSDFDEVEIDLVEHADGVTVCALYPGRRGRSASCEAGDGDNGNMRDLDVEVEFQVHVPAGVKFVGRSVSGDVEAVGLEGDVEAFSVSGDIDITTSGIAHGSTVSGDISVTMGSTPSAVTWTSPCRKISAPMCSSSPSRASCIPISPSPWTDAVPSSLVRTSVGRLVAVEGVFPSSR
jgi:hypothetical protein